MNNNSPDIHKCQNPDVADTLFAVSNPQSADDVWHENVDLMCMYSGRPLVNECHGDAPTILEAMTEMKLNLKKKYLETIEI